MSQRLTDAIIKGLPVPPTGNKITYDTDVAGFGIRITKSGARAFVLNYRTRAGRERRYTIGPFGKEWSTAAARTRAAELKRKIEAGADPLADVQSERDAPTVADLCDRYREKHLPKKRPTSQVDDNGMIAQHIRPTLGNRKVASIDFTDIDDLHRKLTRGTKQRRGTPHRANRVVALLSKLFALSIRWGWRADNPVKGVERNPENRRQRYLTEAELERLVQALAAHEDQEAANIVRLLLLSGARRGEVLAARWEDFDLEGGVWTKPGATTKQKTEHRVPLSAPARQLLAELRDTADNNAVYVFPGRGGEGHRTDLKKPWSAICRQADISGLRLHDLRHSYASFLVSSGLSLPVIGALLGHTQPSTTQRYAHLQDDPLRQATERVGALMTSAGKPGAEIVPLGKERA